MPDISMCNNNVCPLRVKCYRFRALPSEMQSYSRFEPVLENGVWKCEFFIELGKSDKTKDGISKI